MAHTGVWVHGYGVHPSTEELSRAGQQAASELEMTLHAPALTDQHNDGRCLVVPPLQEQADRLVACLDGLEAHPDVVVAHSQAAWVFGMALHEVELDNSTRLELIAPALNNPRARLEGVLGEASGEDTKAAASYGGAHGTFRWMDRDGQPRSIVVSKDYWSEMEGLTDGELLDLATWALFAHAPNIKITRPEHDDRFGDMSEEYTELAQRADEAGIELPIEDVPNTDHTFDNGKELLVARATLGGWNVEQVSD